MLKITRFLLITALFTYLVGCTTIPNESTTNVEWQAHQQALSKIQQFRASGKLGYKSPENKASLNFIWKHSNKQSELRLINFLGQTVLTLTITPQGATIVADDNTYVHNQASTLLYQLTNIRFPVEQMQLWLKGQPGKADSYQLNDTNTLNSLTLNTDKKTWNLDYSRYQDINGVPLPYQMLLSQEETSVKIVISQWNIE